MSQRQLIFYADIITAKSRKPYFKHKMGDGKKLFEGYEGSTVIVEYVRADELIQSSL